MKIDILYYQDDYQSNPEITMTPKIRCHRSKRLLTIELRFASCRVALLFYIYNRDWRYTYWIVWAFLLLKLNGDRNNVLLPIQEKQRDWHTCLKQNTDAIHK